MARAYRVVVADTEGGVLAAAEGDGWTVLRPVRSFSEIDTLDDSSLGPKIGRLFVRKAGFVALSYKEV